MSGLALAGKTYELKMDNGVVFHHTYSPDGKTLHYETIAGPMEQGSEDVRLHTAEVASDVWLVAWNEISGVSVTQAVNLKANTVHVFSTHEAGGERRTEIRTGTIAEVD
ncbi:MoaF-related domain-containing protein [Glycomyces tarimensis]